MPPVLNRQQSREVDRHASADYGLAGLVLMENAGRGTADRLIARGAQGPVLIACGKGNNGGDGFVIARHLEAQGVEVRVAVWGMRDEFRGDAAANLEILLRSEVGVEFFAPDRPPSSDWWQGQAAGDWIVDALLGTGSQGVPRPPLDEAIRRLNNLRRPILAVDLPSGLDCDTGVPAAETIRATETCTFVAAKPGLLAAGAQDYVGQLTVLPIGVPHKLLAEFGRLPRMRSTHRHAQ